MTTAIIIIILVFAFIIGGMITLLKSAKQKFPDTYDKSKVGFDDEDDWPKDKSENPTKKVADENKNEKPPKD